MRLLLKGENFLGGVRGFYFKNLINLIKFFLILFFRRGKHLGNFLSFFEIFDVF